MSGPTYAKFPRVASEAVVVGLVMTESSDKWAIDDAATQATMAQTKVGGVSATSTAADGDEIAVIVNGPARCIAGAAIVAGTAVLAQAGTGRVITYVHTDYTDDTSIWLLGVALEDASGDGVALMVDVRPYVISVSNPT